MKAIRIATSALLVTLAACAVPPSMPKGSTVEVKLQTGSFLRTLAARKTIADINHYHVKLISTATNTVVSEADTTSQDTQFTQVPDGTYRLKANAFDSTGASIVTGGEQTSGNTATVTSPAVSYSDNSNCLKVDVALLNATGEAINNHINVTDGQAWTGTPTLLALPSCACTPPPPPGGAAPTWLPNGYYTFTNGGATITNDSAPAPWHTATAGTTTYTRANHPKISWVVGSGLVALGLTATALNFTVYNIDYGIQAPATGSQLIYLSKTGNSIVGANTTGAVLSVEISPDGSVTFASSVLGIIHSDPAGTVGAGVAVFPAFTAYDIGAQATNIGITSI